MKTLVYRLVFPLTFISYMIFEKWWYVFVIDGPDKKAYGFPLINSIDSFGTSMEFYYFIFETIFNISVFTIFWFGVVYVIDRFIFKIFISSILAKVTLILLSIYLLIFTCLIDKKIFLKRDFGVKVIDKGYHFIWTDFQPKYQNQ